MLKYVLSTLLSTVHFQTDGTTVPTVGNSLGQDLALYPTQLLSLPEDSITMIFQALV